MTRTEIKIEDAVKALTYCIGAVGFLPVARYVGLPYSLAFIVLCGFSLYFEYRKRFPIPRWVLNVVSFSVIVTAFMRIRIEDIVTPSLESLLILLAIKFLEDKRFRDFMQIYIISLFLLAGSSLLSLDAVFLVYFIGLIFLFTIATVLLAYYSQDSAMRLKRGTLMKVALSSLLISCISLPVTLFMFIILPRTSYPLLNFLNRNAGASTGFSNDVRLGMVSSIQEDSTVLMRVNMEKVDDNLLYWRGIVLDYFDGTTWKSRQNSVPGGGVRLHIPGKRVEQLVYLEPYGSKYVFALDMPVDLSLSNIRRNGGLTYARPEDINRRISYRAFSVLSGVLPEEAFDRNMYLQLPEKNLDRIKGLVRYIASGKNDEGAVTAILGFLRDGRYRYSLRKLPVSSDPLNAFLFTQKYGNCEYFASAMAVMLRAAGIPSRMVGGYRGGYYNEVGRYYLIPQKNAHVWVEAYLQGRGWVRVDPTPAGLEDFAGSSKADLLVRARILLDAVSYYWNASVISYDIDRQISLLHTLSVRMNRPDIRLSFSEGKTALGYALVCAVSASGCLFVFSLVKNKRTPEEKVIAVFLRRMGRLGYAKTKSEGLEEFIAKIADEDRKERAGRFVREFEGHFYRDRKLTGTAMQRLKQLIKEI